MKNFIQSIPSMIFILLITQLVFSYTYGYYNQIINKIFDTKLEVIETPKFVIITYIFTSLCYLLSILILHFYNKRILEEEKENKLFENKILNFGNHDS